MQRWHAEVHITRRNWAEHRRTHVRSNISFRKVVGRSAYEVDCVCDEQIGRFRKSDAYDCGNPQCYMCHGDKFPVRELTRQELKANRKFREGIRDLE